MDTATADAISRANQATGTCWLCDVPVRRVPRGDEWGWADEVGGTMGIDGDLARNLKGPDGKFPENPYDALPYLAKSDPGAYSLLRMRLMTGWHHVHTVIASTKTGHGPFTGPWHCAWPMRLTPSGWACRQCGHRQDTAQTLEPAA